MKVPQHWQETECPVELNAPLENQKCEIKAETTPISIETKEPISAIVAIPNQTSKTNESLTQITGGAVTRLLSNTKALKELTVGGLILAIAGILGYTFLYKRK